MVAPPTEHEILDVNRRYHDVAAESYDAKWGISFGEIGHQQVLGKITKLLGPNPGPFAHSLEIGSGTGYFSLNLLQTGVVQATTCTDISPGMLATLERNAQELGLDVETAACDAAELPFDDESFDLVLGHAVLHHLPDLDRAFAEFKRVLKPGGTAVLRGRAVAQRRPHRRLPKRAAIKAAPLWRKALKARPAPTHHGAPDEDEHALEAVVDVHAFVPTDLAAPRDRRRASPTSACAARSCWRTGSAGSTARSRRARTPRTSRGAGSSTPTAATSLLQRVDRALLEPRLPPRIFYNLMLAARKPG